MKDNLTDQLPFWHLDGDVMVYKDGSFGAGFKLSGLDITCLTDEEINHFNRQIENLVLSLPSGLKLQVYYKLGSNIEPLVNKHQDLAKASTEVYQPVLEARIGDFKKQIVQKKFFHPELFLFVRSQPHTYKKRSLIQGSAEFSKILEDDYQNERGKFKRIIKHVTSSLEGSKIQTHPLEPSDWFGHLFEYFNLERSETLGTPALQKKVALDVPSLNSQVFLTDSWFGKDGIDIGKYRFRVVTLKTLPEGQTHASMVAGLLQLPFHFWLSQNISILDQSKEMAKLGLQRRIAHSMAAGSSNVSDIENESRLEKIEELTTELLEGTTKLLSSDLNIIVWDEDHSVLDEKCDEVLKAFRQLNQAEGIVETLPSKEAFFKAAPGVCEGLRHKKMKSSNLVHLMPVYAPWEGNTRPVCLLPNRENSLFSLDPFAKELPNWNGIVFGGSGSGKSFTVAQLMLQFSALKPKIIWIDNGASSQRLLEVLGGEFLDIDISSDLSINMFDLAEGENKPSSEKIKLTLAVLEMILKDDGVKMLPKRDKALLEEAIVKVYSKNKKTSVPRLSDLKELLAIHEDNQMKAYSKILYSWTGDSAYGKLLDRPTTVNLTKDLVGIEVQALSAHPELKDVMLLLLTSHIQDMASKDFERPYLLIVDEAERLFQTELAKQFIITCYRTWRKFNSGIWSLSQNYKDFMQDRNLRDSLMPNTSSVIILRQRKIDWMDFKKTFDFNDAQVEVIKSLQIKKGEFSEFYYLQDENQTVLRLVPEPLSYWICTSDGNDKAKIAKMKRRYPDKSTMETLQALAGGCDPSSESHSL